MGLGGWLGRRLGGRHLDREAEINVGDARFDDWAVVRDFEDLPAALAWRGHLTAAGLDAILTSDWPLDEFGRGDIALRVPQDQWVDADELLGEPD